MITVNKLGVLLTKTANSFESKGVLNPAVIKVGNEIHLFYRAVTNDNYSTIGYCNLSAPTIVETRSTKPLLFPQVAYEFQGLEDPRIIEIEGTFYLSYTAFDGTNALGAVAISNDLIHWQKLGIIVPQVTYQEFNHYTETNNILLKKYIKVDEAQKSREKQNRKSFLWDKNLIFFPRKIDGKIWFLHRIKPDIQIVVAIDKLADLSIDFWQNYFAHFDEFIVLKPKYPHEESYIGGGCPPIETVAGWLLIYHGVHDTLNGYVYSACAALLDIKNPQKEIARLPYPLFSPDKEWELKGEVDNVCFPTGALVEQDTLYIYYGAADERIAVASVSLKELLGELALYKHVN
ncbi:MAG: hypothetical protein ACOVNR_08845 [Chitinophagaceae bacterium]